MNSKLDIYVGTSKGKTTVTAIAGLKNVIYVEKGKTENEARPFHYCLISVIKKHSDESIANIDLLKAPDIIPNRKLESTVGLIPDQPSDILLLFLGDDRATAIKQNPQILIAEKYTNILHMHHLSVLAVEPKTDVFDRDFFFQTGKIAPKYHKSPRHSILLLEAKQQRVYKNKAPYTLLKDEDRRISHKDGETFEVTDKVSLMQLNLVQKRFRTILNSSRTYDHNLSYSTIRDSGDIFEFAFIQDTARYIYFWSPSVSTWVNDLLESAEKIKHQLLERADDGSVQTATNQCIFDLRFDANALELDPQAPHFDEFPTFMAVLSQNTLQQTSWRIGCVGFVTRDNGQRQKVELGYFGFNVSSSLEDSEVFYGYRVLPFVKENVLVVVGFVHHLDRRSKPVALCGYQVTLDPSLQQLLGQSRNEDLESDQYHLLRDHGQVSPTQLFRIDLKDSVSYPPVLVHPKGTPAEVSPYPERETMIKLDTRYDKHKKEYNIAVIATTHRMLAVLSVPCHSLQLISTPPVNLAKSEGHKPAPKQTDLLLSPRTLKTYHFEYQEYKDAPDAMKLGPSGVSWQQEEQKNLILLSSGCNHQITVDFDLLRSQKLAPS